MKKKEKAMTSGEVIEGSLGLFVLSFVFFCWLHWNIVGWICIALSIILFISFMKIAEKESKNQKPIGVDEAVKTYTEYLNKLSPDYSNISSQIPNLNINISKLINYDNGKYLAVDNDSKKFYLTGASRVTLDNSKLLEVLQNNDIRTVEQFKLMLDTPKHQEKLYKDYPALNNLTKNSLSQQLSIVSEFNYGDLIKVDFTDKTTVDEEKTYTIHGREDEAWLGAIIGDMFSDTIVTRHGEFKINSYADVGAIIGASGDREVTEHVNKTVNARYDITLYLNDLNISNMTITVTDEALAKEIFATLNYILCNK